MKKNLTQEQKDYSRFLPALSGFNTLWIWLSMMVIAQHIGI